MKTRIAFAIGIILIFGIGACASNPSKTKDAVNKPLCAEWLKPDSVSYSILGKNLATILFSPQSVKCYHLVGKETIGKNDIEVEQNFVRDTLLATLTPSEVAVIQYVLLKPANSYKLDEERVMSPYIPILEFEFSRRKEKAHVVISLSDLTWTVFYDDKRQFNFNYANHELISQFCMYYVSKYKSQLK